ncbi:ferredoxin-type protein NapF [Lysobacter sp. CAU 1642]|uniref:Ferredoxin-type protein NapF n=1 Tax=Pseudomarimonas salicorniae TaxID=2933270 RepID=A0ABT0GDP9_9GAMM|nr:ferredoxin-type protein NapF [Lysobacter sp. CAU 1642]
MDSRPRPPGAVDEALFVDRCIRCDGCVEACPERVLVRADGGFPILDPSLGECTFCGDCVAACADQALLPSLLAEWPWRAALGAGCLSGQGVVCQACRDACGERAIRFPPGAGLGAPMIDASACSGCGACIGACPTSALRLQRIAISQSAASP